MKKWQRPRYKDRLKELPDNHDLPQAQRRKTPKILGTLHVVSRMADKVVDECRGWLDEYGAV